MRFSSSTFQTEIILGRRISWFWYLIWIIDSIIYIMSTISIVLVLRIIWYFWIIIICYRRLVFILVCLILIACIIRCWIHSRIIYSIIGITWISWIYSITWISRICRIYLIRNFGIRIVVFFSISDFIIWQWH